RRPVGHDMPAIADWHWARAGASMFEPRQRGGPMCRARIGATAMSPVQPTITPGLFDAVLFDLDGVLTSTAKIHARCWKTMFNDFLGRRAAAGKEPLRPFHIETH